MVTDDRKAIRLAGQRVRLVSSLDVVRVWAGSRDVARETARGALIGIRDRASYAPSRDHPHRAWWDETLGGD